MTRFADPALLWLLAALPIVAWRLFRRGSVARVRFPAASAARASGRSWRTRIARAPGVARLAALALLIVALARPQAVVGRDRVSTEGVAIQLVVDRSGSMGQPIRVGDTERPRLEVVQRVLAEFVAGDGAEQVGRESDLIGLVAFARFAETVCPLVQDHAALLDLAGGLRVVADRSEDGTAIGDAIALAATRLRGAEDVLRRRGDADADFTIRSKVVVLLTDGASNAGDTPPEEAAELAARWGVRVYAIGVGAGTQFVTMSTPFGDRRIPVGSTIDEDTLRRVAELTGGRYWPAEDAAALREVCSEIDRLEKTRIETTRLTDYRELFAPAAAAALALLAAECLARATFLRRSP